jgi:hypothetical protein
MVYWFCSVGLRYCWKKEDIMSENHQAWKMWGNLNGLFVNTSKDCSVALSDKLLTNPLVTTHASDILQYVILV